MAITVPVCIDKLQDIYNDVSDTEGLLLFNSAHAEIGRQVKLYPDEAVDLASLVAGTRGYAYSEDILHVWAAAYYTSASSYTALIQTSPDELDAMTNGEWRGESNGTPTHWYDEGPNIGLYPIPDTTTSGGYPLVRLYCQKRRVLTTGDSLPGMIGEATPWVDYMAYLWAERRHRDEKDARYADYKVSLARLKRHMLARAPRVKPSFNPVIPTIRY